MQTRTVELDVESESGSPLLRTVMVRAVNCSPLEKSLTGSVSTVYQQIVIVWSQLEIVVVVGAMSWQAVILAIGHYSQVCCVLGNVKCNVDVM